MKIILDISSLNDFDAWCGAKDTKERIIRENKETEFDALITDIYPEGLTDTQLNDLLWFEPEWIYEQIGIEEDAENE